MLTRHWMIAREAALKARDSRESEERRRHRELENRAARYIILLDGLQSTLAGFVSRDGDAVTVEYCAGSVYVRCGSDYFVIRIANNDGGPNIGFYVSGGVSGIASADKYVGSLSEALDVAVEEVGARWLDPDSRRPVRITIDPLSTWEIMLLGNLLREAEREILGRIPAGELPHSTKDQLVLGLARRFAGYGDAHPFKFGDFGPDGEPLEPDVDT